ncbi:hypothetical protein HK104_004683 [Borealophlyctis nickersoniae]|nr:hypothetical protein HK104_004683 [Borealophlyctis nickersoniae]
MTKLPPFLADSHKRYKADTNRLAQWLVVNAKRLGYELETSETSETSQASSVPTGSKRLKGKARKLAREAGAASGTSAPLPRKRHVLTVQQFTDMAETIARAGEPVPAFVLTIARRAILARKRCADWFRRSPVDDDDIKARKDEGHWHFVGVLEDVVEMLMPLAVPEVRQEAEKGDESTAEVSLENQFSLLEVDENDEEDFEDATQEPPLPPSDVSSIGEEVYEVEEDNSEIRFIIFCLFEDLADIRRFIQQTWTDYREGQIDLITASVTTDMAVNLVRDAEEELANLCPLLTGYEDFVAKPYVYACLCRGEDPRNIDQEFMVNVRMMDVAEFLYLPIYSSLFPLRDAINPKVLPVYKGQYGYHDPRQNRESLTQSERMWEDRRIIVECMSDLVLLAHLKDPDFPLKDNALVHDAFTKEFGLMALSGRISLALVFATQVFIDIHHIFRENIGRGLVELRMAGSLVVSSLKERAEMSPRIQISTWPEQNESNATFLSTIIDFWCVKDAVAIARLAGHKDKNLLSYFPEEPFFLLKRHPWLCGMMQFQVRLMAQETGLTLAGAWGSILYVGHLYEACKYSNVMEGKIWKDMEWVMEKHGKERLFRGKFIGRGKGVRNRGTPRGPSALEENSPVSLMFREHKGQLRKTAFMAAMVERVLQETITSTLPPKLRIQWARNQTMTPLQFLIRLRAGLLAERERIRFDYIKMHVRCMAILRDLHAAVDKTFTRAFGPEYFENETQLGSVVGWVFLMASGSDLARQRMKIRDTQWQSRIMSVSGGVLLPWITREGDAECTKLRKLLGRSC